jgi:acetyltransferase-like isoleucine patch superfamily enzyme
LIIKKIIKRLIFPNTCCSDAYVKYLSKNGVQIGKNVIFFDPRHTIVDITRPYLITIGDYCKITSGVIILSHDYSKSVLRLKYKEIIGEGGLTEIGNNVFIGMNSIILSGVKIGADSIIGAGSVVTNDIPDSVVAAGNPCRVIMSLDEYFKKRKQNTLKEAKEYAKHIFEVTGRKPTIKELDGFYPLFIRRDLNVIKNNGLTIMFSGDDYNDTVKYFMQSEPAYNSFDEFLKDCGIG